MMDETALPQAGGRPASQPDTVTEAAPQTTAMRRTERKRRF